MEEPNKEQNIYQLIEAAFEQKLQALEEENKNLKKQLEEMRGKVREAWDAGEDWVYCREFGPVPPNKPDWEQWSKQNGI